MNIKSYATLEVAVDSCENEVILITGFANKFLHNGSIIVDRSDEAVNPLGIDIKNFLLNPILLFNHDFSQPIGKINDISISNEGIKVTAEVHKSSNPIVYENVEKGILKAFSIGFISKNVKYFEDDALYMFTETELYEISLVAVPDNPLSLIESYSTSCGCSVLGKSFHLAPTISEVVIKTLGTKSVDTSDDSTTVPTTVPTTDSPNVPTNVPTTDSPNVPMNVPTTDSTNVPTNVPTEVKITLEDIKMFFETNKVTKENFNDVYTIYSKLGVGLDEQISLI